MMTPLNITAMVIDSPVGHLRLVEREGCLIYCTWTSEAVSLTNASPFLKNVAEQLAEYFNKLRTHFSIPLNPVGTLFQQAVWRALADIPYGDTRSYQQIAMAVGRVKAYRAAGSANGKNPLCIIIPCHRVIRASGELGGFGGGLANKQFLLALEQG